LRLAFSEEGCTTARAAELVVDFVGGDTREAAKIFGLFGTAWALMQFLFAPLLGSLSDSFGRRPVILIPISALGSTMC
jgi:MFS family permease